MLVNDACHAALQHPLAGHSSCHDDVGDDAAVRTDSAPTPYDLASSSKGWAGSYTGTCTRIGTVAGKPLLAPGTVLALASSFRDQVGSYTGTCTRTRTVAGKPLLAPGTVLALASSHRDQVGSCTGTCTRTGDAAGKPG